MEVSGRKQKDIKAVSESDVEHLCEPCLDIGQELFAVGFCVDCNDFLCGECYKHHRKTRASRDHILQDASVMPKVKPYPKSTINADTADRCSKHKGEIIKFYCRSDRQLGCGSCMITNHRKCEELISIEEEYEKLDNEIAKFNEQLDSHSKTKGQNSIKIETNHSQAVIDIKQFLIDIKTFLETFADKMITEADKLKENDESKMKSVSARCLTLRNDLQTLTSDLAKLHQTQQNGQLLTMMEEVKHQMKTISRDIDQIDMENKVQIYSFEPEVQIEAIKKTLKSFGNLAIEKEVNQTDVQKTSEGDEKTENDEVNPIQLKSQTRLKVPVKIETEAAAEMKLFPLKRRQASVCPQINIKSSTDEETLYVLGLTILSEDHLIFTDSSNKKVKLVSTIQNKIIKELKLSSSPKDITAINDHQVALTMPHVNQIQMLSISNQNISQGQTIKVKGQCYGIVYNDDTLLVTFIDPAKVEMISMTGTVLRVIDKGKNGEPMFKRPQYIALSLDRTHVYLTDKAKHSVICMTLDGMVKGIYKDEGLIFPSGLTVDKTGSVYLVSGSCRKGYIYQISGDCSQGQELLLQQGVWRPQSIAYCQKEDKLYVGQNYIDWIYVFQMI